MIAAFQMIFKETVINGDTGCNALFPHKNPIMSKN